MGTLGSASEVSWARRLARRAYPARCSRGGEAGPQRRGDLLRRHEDELAAQLLLQEIVVRAVLVFERRARDDAQRHGMARRARGERPTPEGEVERREAFTLVPGEHVGEPGG